VHGWFRSITCSAQFFFSKRDWLMALGSGFVGQVTATVKGGPKRPQSQRLSVNTVIKYFSNGTGKSVRRTLIKLRNS
jgi:hypothetical protein